MIPDFSGVTAGRVSRNSTDAEGTLTKTLGEQALEACKRAARTDTDDYRIIRQSMLGMHGDKDSVLRNLIHHLPRHWGEDIAETYYDYCLAGQDPEVLLTDDHIFVRARLYDAYVNSSDSKIDSFHTGNATTSHAQYKEILKYVMEHIEEGYLIVSLVCDRGIGTLEEILCALPALKESSHASLSGGAL